jgi:hypothetical protein
VSGIRISDQHFALGDLNELAIHVPRATRRSEGLEQFSSVELVVEILRRPNANSSVLGLVAQVAEMLGELDQRSIQVGVNLEAVRSQELAVLKFDEASLKSEFRQELLAVDTRLSAKVDVGIGEIRKLSSRLDGELAEARTVAANAASDLSAIREKPYEEFTVKQLLGATWKRIWMVGRVHRD